MITTQNEIHKPNLMSLKLSLPMWSNEEILMEIEELNRYIQDLEVAEQNASYFINKRQLLQDALKARG